MKQRQQNTTLYPIAFLLVSSTDHITPITGATPAVVTAKNGGAFASPAGAVSEIGNGWYSLAGNATDRNTLGEFIIHATATGADPADDRYTIVPWDPFSATNLGLTNLDAAISSRSSHTAADIWAVGARTLTSFGTLVSDIWSAAARTLTSLGNLVKRNIN